MQPGRVKAKARRGAVCTDGVGGVGERLRESELSDRKHWIIAERREKAARDGGDTAPRNDETIHWTKTETRSRAVY